MALDPFLERLWNREVRKQGGKLAYPAATLRQKLDALGESGRRILKAAGVFDAAG